MSSRFHVPSAVAIVAACLLGVRCGGGSTSTSPTPQPPITIPGDPTGGTGTTPSGTGPRIFAGAGDIAMCPVLDPAYATGRLLASMGATVFTLGDNAYDHGTAAEFRNCYDPTWGSFKAYTFPVVGNHEFEGNVDPFPYYDYFGANAGPRGQGWYSHEVGDWHAIALNSNLPITPNSAQGVWLANDLATHPAKCTIAYWHHPLFTSGQNGPQTQMKQVYQFLYDKGVDIVLNGHDHLYERFAPQDADGRRDDARGIREFIVGTGGALLYDFVTQAPNSQVRIKAFGILKLTLTSNAYDWQFIRVDGGLGDSGQGVCH